MELRLPTEGDKRDVLAYRQEFLDNGDSMDGTAMLATAESYEAWLAAVRRNAREETVAPGLVPATTCLAYANGRLVGMIDLRHRLNAHLAAVGGHIGYSVRKSERRKGYASEMLKETLPKAWALGLERVLITCDSRNEASRRTILHNGGVLENQVPDEGRITQRYWISKP